MDLRQGAALLRSSVGEVVLTIIRDGVEGAQIVYKPTLETLTGVNWCRATSGPPEVIGVPTTPTSAAAVRPVLIEIQNAWDPRASDVTNVFGE